MASATLASRHPGAGALMSGGLSLSVSLPRAQRPQAPRPKNRPRGDAEGLETIGALIAGDSGAWSRFVRDHARVICAAVGRRLLPAGCGGEVDDVAQDVFVRLCRSDFKLLRNFDPARAKLSTWLTVIATSAAIDHLRKRRNQGPGLDEVPESCLAVEDPVFERVRIPPGLLSPRQAMVVELLYRKEMDVAEAAALMNCEAQTVRSTHHKALAKLRQHFQAERDG